ncbi:hypothetical protein ACFW34_35650 [Streptomyces sp. NPDC058848]
MTRTKRALAVSATAAGILAATASSALAQTTAPPERNQTITAHNQDR